MQLGIQDRFGWALMEDFETGRAAIMIGSLTDDGMHFRLVQWCNSLDEAMDITWALNENNVTPANYDEIFGGKDHDGTEQAKEDAGEIEGKIIADDSIARRALAGVAAAIARAGGIANIGINHVLGGARGA